jgi:cytoskeleton protein RodZ
MMDTSDVAANAPKATDQKQTALNVGKTLREAREGMGLSVHDIANRLKFAPRQVEALEANDFGNLPQATFLRGFVRSYARVLQLDEMALIAALPSEPAQQVVVKPPIVDVAFPTLLSLQRINLFWLAGTLGVALLLGLFLWLHDGEPVAKPTEAVVESVPLPTAEDAAASAVVETGEQTSTPETVKVVPSKKIAEPVKARETVSIPVSPRVRETVTTSVPQTAVVSAPVASEKSELPLEALKRRPLHFIFGEATWAEVTDARGVVLLSRNIPRGTEKWIGGPGHAPYNISIANPRKVKLYYKGNPIDLSPYAGMEMAHLKVK